MARGDIKKYKSTNQEDVISVVDNNEVFEIDLRKAANYKYDQIKYLEDLVKKSIKTRNRLLKKYDNIISKTNVELGNMKAKSINTIINDLNNEGPINYDYLSELSNKIHVGCDQDMLLLLDNYFDIKEKNSNTLFKLLVPKKLSKLFVPGNSNLLYFGNYNDIVDFNKNVLMKYGVFKKEKFNYVNQYNSSRMDLYMLDGYIDFNQFASYFKYHKDKMDYRTVYDIQDGLLEIKNIMNSRLSKKKKKSRVDAVSNSLLKSINDSVNQVKNWYVANIYNSDLGIERGNLEHNSRIESVVNDPNKISYLYSLIDGKEKPYKDLLYEVEIVATQIKLRDQKEDQKLDEVVKQIKSNASSNDIRKVLDLCYSLSNRYTDGNYTVVYNKPRKDIFVHLALVALKLNNNKVKKISPIHNV